MTLATIQNVQAAFAAPPASYRMMPLLRVNDEIDAQQVRWQVQELKRQGFGGMFCCCERFGGGAPQPFVSEWWWRAVEVFARACAAEELAFWVYDDEDWPSGSIGGQLTADNPEHGWRYLHSERRWVHGPMNTNWDEDAVAVVAWPDDGAAYEPARAVDLTGRKAWEAPAGDWLLAIYTARQGPGIFLDGYGDLMSRDAMATFIDQVYRTHVERVEKMGGRVAGFFTDEPAMSLGMVELPGRSHWYPSLPYTPALAEAFERQWGDSLTLQLPMLGPDMKDVPGALRLRCQYWQTCCELYDQNYFEQISRFCDEHGVLFSGHLVVEEDFRYHLAQQGGNLPMHLRHMHVPGVDWIHPCDSHQHLPSTTFKYATSAAALMERKRIWCESFAASGWGASFQEMRRIVNWEHINGINMQVPISYKHSLRGQKRATFYNPGLSYQQPYWDFVRGFADYEARACVLAAAGQHVASVAIYYPAADIRAHCWEHDLLTQRSEIFNRLGDALRFGGYDYHILDDDGLDRTREPYAALLLPSLDVIERRVLERALAMAEAGGTVLFCGSLPRHSSDAGNDDPAVDGLIRSLLGDDPTPAVGQWRQVGQGRAAWVCDPQDVPRLLHLSLPRDVVVHRGRDIVAHRRRLGEDQLFLLLNALDAAQTVTLSLPVEGSVEQWCLQTGRVRRLRKGPSWPGWVQLRLSLAPHDMIAVWVRPDGSDVTLLPPAQPVREITIDGTWQFQLLPTMDRPHVRWNFSFPTDDQPWTAAAVTAPSDVSLGDWRNLGLTYYSGQAAYEKQIELGELPDQPRIVLSLGRVGMCAQVSVNGRDAGYCFFAPYELDITEHVLPGINHLRIVVANTLSNHYAQFDELRDQPLSAGGDRPERRASGLLGPVAIQLGTTATTQTQSMHKGAVYGPVA